MSDLEPRRSVGRFETGVPGLDEILAGGYFRGGANLVLGPPGSGKTILSAQMAFHHARSGERTVYVTVLTEPHGRMIEHLRAMRFYEERFVPDAVYFVSGYRALAAEGLEGLLQLAQSLVRDRGASMFVLDGASVIAGLADGAVALQRFVYELNAFLSATNCTGLIVSTGGRPIAEETMVESITMLEMRSAALRCVRELRVLKLRGGQFHEGGHHYVITEGGLTVFPRLEAVATRRAAEGAPEESGTATVRRLPFGIAELDRMLEGGIPASSTTTLVGAPGSGKTMLGTRFLATGAAQGERGLYFGLFESPARLVAKLEGIGVPFGRYVQDGHIATVWHPPMEHVLDALALHLLETARRQRPRRLFVDGIDGFRLLAADPERLPAFFLALASELRALGITTLFAEETNLFRPEVLVPLEGMSPAFDNIILLRYVEVQGQLRRLISVVKLRDGGYDSSLRELRIDRGGLSVAAPSGSAETVMTGVARQAVASSAEPPHHTHRKAQRKRR